MSKVIILLSVYGFFVLSCGVQKNAVSYEFPTEMTESVRTQFKADCDKGKILYEINCAQCHNLSIKGKSVVPDFNPEQLKGYEIRVANARHEESMPDERVTAEELVYISTYLTYKKKSGVKGP